MKDLRYLIRFGCIYAKNYLLEGLAIYFPRIVPKPTFIGLSVGALCNLRCKHCDFWKMKTNPNKYLKTRETKQILIKLKNWLGPFRLVFTGAEPFIRKDILELISFASKNGIYTSLTSNGQLIDKKIAKAIVKSGLDFINISLDGASPETHDFLRGVKGSYQKATDALKFLVKERKKGGKIAIYILTVVMKRNLSELEDLVKLSQEIGCEIHFQALESKHLYGKEKYDPLWFKKNPLWPHDSSQLERASESLIRLKKKGAPIKNSYKELTELAIYYQNPLMILKKNKFCFTGVRNFAIDEYGDVKFCFAMEPVGSVLKQKLEEIWYGKKAEGQRKKIRNCRRYCRILLCNRRQSLSEGLLSFWRIFLLKLSR
ncbi:radical SAM protein [Patescibacteria group bacterium]|nr:radical SAM protein [Patescibacteria group bacterium]